MARTRKSGLAFLDTHIVCWLYEGRVDLLSQSAIAAIEQNQVCVSPIVRLELEYLHEIGRIRLGAHAILATLNEEIGLRVEDASFASIIEHAAKQTWTRDPFDRIITAHALMARASLITKDQVIRNNFTGAIW